MELNHDFIEELFKASITEKNTLEILNKHLTYSHLPTSAYKTIWKEISTFYELEGKPPTIGIINQSLEGVSDPEIKTESRHILAKIKKIKVENVHTELLGKFETYKKQVEFTHLFKEVADMYNSSDEEKAIKYMAEKSDAINRFSIKDGFYERVFSGFEGRHIIRSQKDPDNYDERISSGIHEQDYYTRGGYKKGTGFLWLGRSGSGKSTLLRWKAISAARMGKRVVIFSMEDLKDETLEAIDACWTSTPLSDIEFGKMPESKVRQVILDSKKWINEGGEIFVHCSESFEGMTIEDCVAIMRDIEKIYGKIDMALFDYLELFADSKKEFVSKDSSGERRRRESIANKIVNVAVDFKCVTGTVTQANDIPPNLYNNPDFYMTRSHISEFKGVLKPFSYFATINQTEDESEQNVARLYYDKFRKHKSGQIVKIYQRLDVARFYDAQKTLKYLWDKNTKRQIG